MDGWWAEVETVVRQALEHRQEVSPAEIARRLHVSEEAAASLLGILASAGTVRITKIGLPPASSSPPAVARTLPAA